MTNATIANELRDAILGSCSEHERLTLNNKALDVAVHETSNAWRGAGDYRIRRVTWGVATTYSHWYNDAVTLAWDAFLTTTGIASIGDVYAEFSVDYLGESF